MIEKVHRRNNYLVTVVALAVAIGAVVLNLSSIRSSAQSPGPFLGADVSVGPDTAHGTTTLVPPSATGAFQQLGILTNVGSFDSSVVGTLRRQGFKFADGSVVVNDQYDLSGLNGSLSAQGTLSNISILNSNINVQEPPIFNNPPMTTLLGITSGTGTFRFDFGGIVLITPVTGATDGSFIARLATNTQAF